MKHDVKLVNGYTLMGESVEMAINKTVWRPSVYAVIYHQDNIAVMQNATTGNLELPGGGIEIYEDVQTALHREIWEEIGVKVNIQRLLDVEDSFFLTPSGKHWHTIKIIYLAEYASGELRSSILAGEEDLSSQWVTIKDIEPSRFQLGHRAIELAKHLLMTD